MRNFKFTKHWTNEMNNHSSLFSSLPYSRQPTVMKNKYQSEYMKSAVENKQLRNKKCKKNKL